MAVKPLTNHENGDRSLLGLRGLPCTMMGSGPVSFSVKG